MTGLVGEAGTDGRRNIYKNFIFAILMGDVFIAHFYIAPSIVKQPIFEISIFSCFRI
jgi:hypothetical protein